MTRSTALARIRSIAVRALLADEHPGVEVALRRPVTQPYRATGARRHGAN